MSRVQRFFRAIMPRTWFEAAEADSRRWMVRCPCGAEQSLWDAGGIRWKGKGKTLWRRNCVHCGERRWHSLVKVDSN